MSDDEAPIKNGDEFVFNHKKGTVGFKHNVDLWRVYIDGSSIRFLSESDIRKYKKAALPKAE